MSVGAKQVAYITDLLDGMSVTEIAAKHGVKQPTVSQAIHRALGKDYKGRIVHGIKMSVFRQIIEEANNGLCEQGTGGMARRSNQDADSKEADTDLLGGKNGERRNAHSVLPLQL